MPSPPNASDFLGMEFFISFIYFVCARYLCVASWVGAIRRAVLKSGILWQRIYWPDTAVNTLPPCASATTLCPPFTTKKLCWPFTQKKLCRPFTTKKRRRKIVSTFYKKKKKKKDRFDLLQKNVLTFYTMFRFYHGLFPITPHLFHSSLYMLNTLTFMLNTSAVSRP